jgi:hypothetical protein
MPNENTRPTEDAQSGHSEFKTKQLKEAQLVHGRRRSVLVWTTDFLGRLGLGQNRCGIRLGTQDPHGSVTA